MSFTRRYEAGGWLVGGSGGTLAVCTTAGVRDLVLYSDASVQFLDANGRFDDLLVAVAWRNASFQAPFINLMADAGLILAMSADGGIVEGRRLMSSEVRSSVDSAERR